MSKFKIGDRVRVLTPRMHENSIGIVFAMYGGAYEIVLDTGTVEDFHESELELIVTSPTPADVISIMNGFTDEQRMEVVRQFCRYCGDKDPGCQCRNDE